MNCYFLSDIPAHLKINGEYIGLINNNLYSLNLENENCFFEFLPTLKGYFPAYGCNTNANLRIFIVNNIKIVYPVFNYVATLPFKFLFQKSEVYHGESLTVTTYQDGNVKFFLDGFISDIKSLPFTPKNVEINFYLNYAIISFSLEKTAIFVYDITTKKLVYNNVINSFSVDSDLIIKKSYQTVTKTEITEVWNLNGEFKLISRTDEKLIDFDFLHPYLTPIAFLENVVIGGSVEKIITKNLNDRIFELKEFLGNVIRVIKPPFNPNAVYLVKNDCLSVCTLQYENRLISNILIDDFY